MRRITAMAAAAILALSLTGCINITPVDKNADGTVDNTEESILPESGGSEAETVELANWEFTTPRNWNPEKSGDTIRYVTNDGVTEASISFIDSSEAYKAFSESLGEDLALKTLASSYLHGFEDEGMTGKSQEIDVSDIAALEGAYCEVADIVESNAMGGGVIALCIDQKTAFVGMLTYDKDKYTQADIDDVTSDFLSIVLGATPLPSYQKPQPATAESAATDPEDKAESRDEATAEASEPQATTSQRNALSMANDYLDYTAFSPSGLIEQLEYEGFSNEDATWAVDNCGADWTAQADRMAAQYMDYSSFSHSGLVDQLVFEGFTQEQAEHGADSVEL